MDQPDRIPIDLGPAVAVTGAVSAEAPQPSVSATRVTERPDGSLVIDVLVPQPCVPSAAGEIVVCAPAAEGVRYPAGVVSEPPATLMDQLKDALSTKIGPVEIGPINGGIEAKVRF